MEFPPWYRQYDPLPKHGPIHNVPVEILIRIFQFVAPPRTRDGLYELSKLTHVCRFWRKALINQPRLWSAVFITQKDRRTFVEACLERSHPVTLDVTVEAQMVGKIHSDCTCDKGPLQSVLPNESNPCERHFQFELLTETKHSNRIRALDIYFGPYWLPCKDRALLALGSCRFFTSTFPRLVDLKWGSEGTHADYLFSTPPFVPPLRSLTYVGDWNSLVAQVNNLTFFSFADIGSSEISTEAFRLLLHNNGSLESLVLEGVDFKGDSKGPPVHLLNLKSLTVDFPSRKLSTIIRIPAFQRLSSLHISSKYGEYQLFAEGDGVRLSIKVLDELTEDWENLTGYAKPVIRHIRFYDGPERVDHFDHFVAENSAVALLMMNAQTLEVGYNYLLAWCDGFWDNLKQLGTQLKTIRFEISGEMELYCTHDQSDCWTWDAIEDLVKYRFEQGRPFSAVERLVVSESERENRLQAYLWRWLYGSRKLAQYVQV
jgi:hypothetical protein